MLDLMNEIPELVYVSDIDTYELLFLNATGKRMFCIDSLKGEKCYKVLQGRNSPCEYCNNRHLSMGRVCAWEHTNPILEKHYLLKDSLIDWHGRTARIEIAFDMTEQVNQNQELQNALHAEHMVLECVRLLYQTTDITAAIQAVLENVGRFLSADRAYIFDIRGDKMDNSYEWCAPGISPEIDNLQGLDICLIDRWRVYFDRNEFVTVEDLDHIRDTSPDEYRVLSAQGIKSIVVAPLERFGELVGYIGVDNSPPDKLHNISSVFHTLIYFLMFTIRKVEDDEILAELSYYDILTGFYNRNRYMRDLKIFSALECSVGIVYLDVNGLKDINDCEGHEYGDQVLVDCSQKISFIFKDDYPYRIGGDEFLVVCRDVTKSNFYDSVQKLKNQFAISIKCNAAIGYKWSERMGDIRQMIADADAMMYEDKKSYYRKNLSSDRYRHYNDDVLGLATPKALKKMLDDGQFLVYLQPKIRLEDCSLIGAEALVRFKPLHGDVVPPSQFLPILEDTKLISLVDFYVFDYICAQIAGWIKEDRPVVPISVNFSRYSLPEGDFVTHLNRICEKYAMDKRWVEIEITETVEGAEGFDLVNYVRSIRSAGYSVSIDDFGVNYANMGLFSSIDFDVLKIDKSLIDNISSSYKAQLVIESLVGICKRLGIRTIIEGVETEEQCRILKRIGCEEAQGYLFCRPLPIENYVLKYNI